MELGFFDGVWSGILEFGWLIIVAIPVGLLLALAGNKFAAEITWRQRRVKVLGIFFKLTLREQFFVVVGFLRVLFVAVILLFGIYLKTPHTVLYIALFLLANGLFFAPKKLMFDFLNSGIVYVALVVSNLLIGFYRDATGDGLMLVIYSLLGIFIVQYTAYFYLKNLYTMLQEKEVPDGCEKEATPKVLWSSRFKQGKNRENFDGDKRNKYKKGKQNGI